MKILDAHHHIWIPERTQPDIGYSWLRDIGAMKPFGDPTPIQRDYELEEFLTESKQHEMVGSVFLQTDGALADPVKETVWVDTVFSGSDLAHAIVGFVDLESPNAETIIQSHLSSSRFRGVRQIVSYLDAQPARCFAPKHYLRSSNWTKNLSLLSKHNLSFDLQLYPEQMHEAAEVFSKWPDIALIIDHAGSPWDASDEGLLRWKSGVSALSELPNCTMKLSGFGMFDARWSADSIHSMMLHCVQSFGPSRMMFGSNFPVDKLMADYDDVVNRVSTALDRIAIEADLPVETLQLEVFVTTAQRVYKL